MWETGMTYHQTNVVMSMTQSIEGLSKAFLSVFPFFLLLFILLSLPYSLFQLSEERERESPQLSVPAAGQNCLRQ